MSAKHLVLSSMFGFFTLTLAACEAAQTGGEEAAPEAAAEQPVELQTTSDELMTFFLTSVGTGDGADLGGLEGADNHCLILAEAVGAVNQTWRAYLSTQTTGGQPAVNARDRIGEGPWHNVNGLLIANNVDQLHYDNSNINYDYALNERGERMNSGAMGDSPNQHDILTGTQMDGTAFGRGEDRTCDNWTSSSEGSALLGHHDRFSRTTPGASWNSAHPSRGCSQPDLEATGGAGLFFCFAVN